MINLNVRFTTGTNYIAVGNPNDKLITVLNNLFQKEKINPKIMNCLGGGSKLDMNKTLSQNNLNPSEPVSNALLQSINIDDLLLNIKGLI